MPKQKKRKKRKFTRINKIRAYLLLKTIRKMLKEQEKRAHIN